MPDEKLSDIKRLIAERGWQWGPGKHIPYGEQLLVSDGTHQVTLDFYPKRGRIVIGGAASPLRAALETLTTEARATSAPAAAALIIPPPHTGMDESGKGDWFGPLVIAAVFANEQTAGQLMRVGVRDSKTLSAAGIARLAGEIERIVPQKQRRVRRVEPVEYNRRFTEFGNTNLMLAAIYAAVAADLAQNDLSGIVVCDQFATTIRTLDSAFASRGLAPPRQLHQAEQASIAVAAASILATAAFHEALVTLGRQAGLDEALPRGASDLPALKQAARWIIANHGSAALGEYAKLNFKPVQALVVGAQQREP